MNNSIENLYKKGSNESTPTALDNLILNAAKQSCDKKTVKKTQPKNWLYAVSTAAVLVMGLSVIFNLQNQNSEIKTITNDILEAPSLEQDKVQEQTVSAPPLEPHLRAKKKSRIPSPKKENFARTRLGKIITSKPTKQVESDTLTNEFENNKPAPAIVNKVDERKPPIHFEQDSSTTQNANESLVILEKILPVETDVETIEFEETSIDESSQNFDKTTVSGMRRAAKPLPKLKKENNLLPKSIEIEKLEALIMAKKYKQAQVLLTQLQNTYPNYNWQKYQQQILKLENISAPR